VCQLTDRFRESAFLHQCALSWQILPLSFIAGGILSLGMISAPVVFKNLPLMSAGPLMATIFSRFENVLIALWIMLSIGAFLEVLVRKRQGTLHQAPNPLARPVVRLSFYILLSIALFYSTFVVSPELRALQHAGIHRLSASAMGQHFEQLHRLSETLYKTMFMFAVVLLGTLPFSFVIEDTSTTAEEPTFHASQNPD